MSRLEKNGELFRFEKNVTIKRIIKIKTKISKSECIKDQQIETNALKIIPTEMRCPFARRCKNEELNAKTPIAKAGEKSKLPKRKKRIFLNRFKNGSQRFAKNCPNFEYCADGNQVSITRTKTKSVYAVTRLESVLKIVDNIKTTINETMY